MTVDSYLELFTTLFGWAFYGILWDVLVGTGIVYLPFVGIVIDNWREPAEGGEFGKGFIDAELDIGQVDLELAEQIVTRYHGADAAREAKEDFQQKFQAREFPDEPDARVSLRQADLQDPATPSVGLVDLVVRTKLVPSKSEARRLIVQGAVEIDGAKHQDPNASLTLEPGRQYRMRIGRRKFALVDFHS